MPLMFAKTLISNAKRISSLLQGAQNFICMLYEIYVSCGKLACWFNFRPQKAEAKSSKDLLRSVSLVSGSEVKNWGLYVGTNMWFYAWEAPAGWH